MWNSFTNRKSHLTRNLILKTGKAMSKVDKYKKGCYKFYDLLNNRGSRRKLIANIVYLQLNTTASDSSDSSVPLL